MNDMLLEFEINEKIYKVSISEKEKKFFVSFNNNHYEIDCVEISENCYSLIIGKESYTVFFAKSNKKIYIHIRDEEYIIDTESKEKAKTAGADFIEHQDNLIYPPMPGKILKIMVKEGEKVRKKQSLVIVEAMKMEHDIRSPFEAMVSKINYSEGQTVDIDSPLIELKRI